AHTAGSTQVDLVFQATRGPLMSLGVNGVDLPRSRRSEVTGLVREGGARPDALESGAEKIEDYLRREGYRDASVRYRSEGEGDAERVVYDVQPGPAAVVVAVEVQGEDDLSSLVKTRPGEPLREAVVTEDVRILRETLQERGHAS